MRRLQNPSRAALEALPTPEKARHDASISLPQGVSLRSPTHDPRQPAPLGPCQPLSIYTHPRGLGVFD